ncbi:MAG: SDR family NAD(P)-dependent oxidoreductase [candidate division NC10 bacterium]|nr:SDR family NAD(P)-dependent oxidoreductase [candidate division NC10 bacterium]
MGRDRVVIVTGAGRGIGRAIARRLAAARNLVAFVDLDKAALERVAAEIRSEGGNVSYRGNRIWMSQWTRLCSTAITSPSSTLFEPGGFFRYPVS